MANKKCFLAIFTGVFLSIFSSGLFADMLDDIVAEINYVRTRPQEYASKRLTPRLKKYKGLDYYQTDKLIIATKEGAKACVECIEVLKKQKPLSPLTMDYALCRAAAVHKTDQSRSGKVGHQGSDGSYSSDRIKKAGFEGSIMGENISYGATTAIDIVANLMIDDGVPDRGHRANFLESGYEKVGVAYAEGFKAANGSVCVIDLGGSGEGQQSVEPQKQSSSKKRDGGQQGVTPSRQDNDRKNDENDNSDYDNDDYDDDDGDFGDDGGDYDYDGGGDFDYGGDFDGGGDGGD